MWCPVLFSFFVARLGSIPFKRDSVLQGVEFWQEDEDGGFQFPSNGIVYCKRVAKTQGGPADKRFNSLQTG